MTMRLTLSLSLLAVLVAGGCSQGPGTAVSDRTTPTAVDVVILRLEEPVAGIYGLVFADVNGSGIIDSGEVGIPGVTVTLDGVEALVTDALGMYSFAVTSIGVHEVTETDPPGYVSTTPNAVSVAMSTEGSYKVDFGDKVATAAPILDVKPGSKKNPINLSSKGVTPVAIVGTPSFDVRLIDAATLLLEGVAPLRFNYEDAVGECPPAATEAVGEDDDPVCADGAEDMVLKFETQALAAAIGRSDRGDVVTLHLTGALKDGTPIAGAETVSIVKGN